MFALSPRIALPLLLILVGAVYLPGLTGPLILDDRNNLAPLAAIDQGTLSAWAFVTGRNDGALFRPVANASFLLSWWLSGDDVFAFKAANLFVHLLCGLAVFVLARTLLRIAWPRHTAKVLDTAALFACAMWMLSPLLVSTVLYTVQRMAQLSMLFTLLGLICYVHGRQRQAALPIVLALAVMWPLAVLSKENGALLPLLAALIEWWWLPADAHGRRWRVALMLCMALVAFALLAQLVHDPRWLLSAYQDRDFTLHERLFTQPPALLDYLGNLLLLPGSSAMSVFRDDYPLAGALWASFSTMFWLSIIGASVFFRHRGPLPHALGFGLLFFVCAHLVESSIFGLELYFEHRNYLPAFGVFFALASGGLWMLTRIRAPIIASLATMLVLGCALLAVQRTLLWGQEDRLYTHATRTHPQSARAWLGLSSVQFAQGQFDAALTSLARGARTLPPASRAAIALQGIAAHCVAHRAVPETLWQQLRDAPALGSDLFTINAIAWMAGAFRADTCTASERARVRQMLAAVPRGPAASNPTRQGLRDAHLQQLLTVP